VGDEGCEEDFGEAEVVTEMKPVRTKPVPYCLECGAKMVLRRPRPGQDWSTFWGCSLFPDCRGTRSIGSDGLPEADDSYGDWND